MILENGYIQIYTGEGKGKTTASFGQALRMVAAGGQVFIAQFLKGRESGERTVIGKLPGVTVAHFGSEHFVHMPPTDEDYSEASRGFAHAAAAIRSGEYDMVVLDEINPAVGLGLVDEESVLSALRDRSPQTEVILTGRNAPESFIETADLVTEMSPIKHYFDKGVHARKGIEE